MTGRFPIFDRSRLKLSPLSEREHDLDLSIIADPAPAGEVPEGLMKTAEAMVRARDEKANIILMMGAHVLRAGVQKYLIDLMEKGLISCLAMNGACAIHDYELALIGATTESVARYIKDGRFGLWAETGGLNEIIRQAASENLGFGEAVGLAVHQGDFPHKDISVFAKAHELGILTTVHAGLGYDIIHEHPNFDGAALGQAGYRDFLYFAQAVEGLENGVLMNFGTAVMGPEVFLKALAMVRNANRDEGGRVNRFTSLVCDLKHLPGYHGEEAPKSQAEYYFRPWKTMLVRTVSNGGTSHYVRGDHRNTVPQLWTALNDIGA